MELDEVADDIQYGYGWSTLESARQIIEIVTKGKKFNWEDKVYNKDGLVYQDHNGDVNNVIEYLRERAYIFPTELDEKKEIGNKSEDINILSKQQVKEDRSGPWATSGTSIDKYYLSTDFDVTENEIITWAEEIWGTAEDVPIITKFELEGPRGYGYDDLPLHGYLTDRNEYVLTVKTTIYYN